MYKKIYQRSSLKLAAESLSGGLSNGLSAVRLVLISGGQAASANKISVSRRSSRGHWTAFAFRMVFRVINAMLVACAWAFSARLVRAIGPGHQALERHEFESVEMRQGGFGGPF